MKIFLPLFILFSSCSPILLIEEPFQKAPTSPVASAEPASLRILVIDVGQGDATLVIGPDGHTMLIDGGPPETGAPAVLQEMSKDAIDHLDWVVATHYDADHIGGLPAVLAGFPPRTGLVDRGDETDHANPVYQDYLAAAASFREEAEPGEVFALGDGATASVVVVNGRYSDGREIHLNPDEENEACIGLLIHYGNFNYFTAGDLTGGGAPGGYESKDMESWVGEIVGEIDVLHIGHHGSATSTNEGFVEATDPEAAIISVGRDNNYGHPNPAVLNRLQDHQVRIYRTDETGGLKISSDGTRYEVTPMEAYISTKTVQTQSALVGDQPDTVTP